MRILAKESPTAAFLAWPICKSPVGLADTYSNKMLVFLDCVAYPNRSPFVIASGIMSVKYWLSR